MSEGETIQPNLTYSQEKDREIKQTALVAAELVCVYVWDSTYDHPVFWYSCPDLLLYNRSQGVGHGVYRLQVLQTVMWDLVAVKPHIGQSLPHECVWPEGSTENRTRFKVWLCNEERLGQRMRRRLTPFHNIVLTWTTLSWKWSTHMVHSSWHGSLKKVLGYLAYLNCCSGPIFIKHRSSIADLGYIIVIIII